MNITASAQEVEIVEPALDGAGKPRQCVDGTPMLRARSMTLEQYGRHMRDPDFAAAIPADKQMEIAIAIAAAE